jgi:O-antigen/teichoic acid export membrane protein
MVNRIKGLILHPLFSGSALMIVGSNLSNLIAYIYHVIVGRMLGPSLYGELVAVLSIIGLFAAFFSFLGLVIVKFVSAAKENEVQSIVSWFGKKTLVIGFAGAFLVFLVTPFLSRFLHIEYSIIVMLPVIFLFAIFGFLYTSFLQGLLRFKEIVISTNVNMIGRLILSTAFIYLGFSVLGAVLGILLAAAISLLLLRYFLKEYNFSSDKKIFKDGKKVFKYTTPILFASLSTYSIFSTDVLLVKHFFSPYDAGIYASLSTLGKIIFYGAAPIASVMFPMISKRHSKGLGYRKIFTLSLLLTAAIAGSVVFIYWLFPQLMVKLLYGSEFLSAAANLVWFGLFMAIFTLGSLILNYYLSREKTTVVPFVVLAALVQAGGIWFFHDSILTVIRVSIFAASLLLGALLIYFGYETRQARFA